MELPPLHLPQRWKSVLGRHWPWKIKTKRERKPNCWNWWKKYRLIQKYLDVKDLNSTESLQSKAKRSHLLLLQELSTAPLPNLKHLVRQTCRLSCAQKTPPLTAQNYPPRNRVHPRPVWLSSLSRTLPGGKSGKHPPRILVTKRNSTVETEQQLWELCRAARCFFKSWLECHNI